MNASAFIDPGAKIGRDVQIGPGVVIENHTEIGDGCVLGPHSVVRAYTRLGNGVHVHAGAVLGDTPQDMAFKNIISHVRIGDRCVFREGVTVHRGTKEGTETTIGDDCYLMANSHVAHNCVLGNRVILANGVLLGGYVFVGPNAFISGNAVIHQFCHVGRLAMVGGLSGISKDVPPFCMTQSVDMNLIVGLNIVGMRRNGFNPEQRKHIRACFNVLYRQGLNVSQALELLKPMATDPASTEFVTFIEQSKRGICRFAAQQGETDDHE